MPSTRRSAKQVVTDMANSEIKKFDTATDDHQREFSRNFVFVLEMVALRMDWTELNSKLKRWRSENLRRGLNLNERTNS